MAADRSVPTPSPAPPPPAPVAIVGLGGRYPGEATSPQRLWDMVAGGRDGWSEVPPSRFNHEAFYHPDQSRNGATNVKGGYFLREDLAYFDAAFFGMTKTEAASLDPQQRLLLECCYETLENAGMRLEDISGSDMGVFVGSFCSDWAKITLRDPDSIPLYHATGTGQAMLANRLSYFFNLHGPSVTVDTACSASLVALHLACQAIRSGECRSALVGGVNALLCHDSLGSMSSMGFLSPDGRSYTYDGRANGYGRGEGVSCVLLKPLDRALEDGDAIRAVIRNTGVNQDGKTPGITFPSARAQAALIRRVYEQAGLDPRDTSYVEAHGTGTQAGDPIEASALFETFGRARGDEDGNIAVGCLKTNIGHLEGASGVAALVKTVMMLENETILPNVGFESPNARIPLEDWRIEVPTAPRPWRSATTAPTLRASINGFGYGGTNAHVIVDSARDYLLSQGIDIAPGSSPGSSHGSSSIEEAARRSLSFSSNSSNSSAGSLVAASRPSTSTGPASPTDAEFSRFGQPVIVASSSSSVRDGDLDSTYGSLGRSFKFESILSSLEPSDHPLVLHHPTEEVTPVSPTVEEPYRHTPPSPKLFVLSAFDEQAGKTQAAQLQSYLASNPTITEGEGEAAALSDLAFTLGKRRSTFPWKAGVVASTRDELCAALEQAKFRQSTRAPTVGFVFTGQGAQWYAMGRELMHSSSSSASSSYFPEFQKSLDLSDAVLGSLGAGWSVAEELSHDAPSTRVNEAAKSQPLCTVLQIALVDLLRSWGVTPAAVVGHSSGEIAAAYTAGLISREVAVATAYYRGLVASSKEEAATSPPTATESFIEPSAFPKGAMAAVSCPEAEARDILASLQKGRVTIACYNSPSSFTVSGDEPGVQELLAVCADRGITARKLVVNVAYHSHHMLSVAEVYRNTLLGKPDSSDPADNKDNEIGTHLEVPTSAAPMAEVKVVAEETTAPPAPTTPITPTTPMTPVTPVTRITPTTPFPHKATCEMFSSVTGQRLDPRAIGPDYWVENLVSPVRFSEALTALCFETNKKPSRRANAKAAAAAHKKAAVDVLVELGPHSALAGPIRQILQSHAALSSNNKITYLSALVRNKDAAQTALALAASLFEAGAPVDVAAINNRHAGSKEDKALSSPILADLPSYPWNHATAYWAEPRESVRYRQRQHDRHDLLGAEARFGGSNTLDPRWRQLIRAAETPWLRDHRVQGLVVYPAAGYICMAIEAARQRARLALAPSDGTRIDGYELREVSLGQALIIPEGADEVEAMISLRPYAESSRESSGVWHEFFIYSCGADGSTWAEHCRGLISVKYTKTVTGALDAIVEDEQARLDRQTREQMLAACVDEVDIPALYEHCTNIGLEYGPTFANLTRARSGRVPSQLVAGTVTVPDVAACMPMHHHSPVVVHPATLDACLHGIMAFRDTLKAAIMPIFFSDIYISDAITKTAGDPLDVFIDVRRSGFRNLDISLTAYEGADVASPDISEKPVIRMTGLKMASLAGTMSSKDSSAATTSADGSGKAVPKTYYQMEWRPDPTFLQSEQFDTLCAYLRPSAEESEALRQLDQASFYMADAAIQNVPEEAVAQLTPKNDKLYRMIRRRRDDVYEGRVPYDTTSWTSATQEERDALWATIRASGGDEGNLLAVVAENLHRIILGEVDPLEVTMKDDALGRYYANNPRMARQYAQAAVYIDLLANKNPHLRILEIGAGTGGATIPILKTLGESDNDTPRFLSYDVTDITSGFFDAVKQKAKAQLGPWAWASEEEEAAGTQTGMVRYHRLDVERDPTEQGFEAGTYDLIVAANVLHATRSMARTVAHARKLLRPGGTLVLIELMRVAHGVADIFGIFDGWWVAEEAARQEAMSPLLTEAEWDVVLKQNGFSGLDASVWETPDPITHQGTTIVSTAIAEEPLIDLTENIPPVIVTDAEGNKPWLEVLARGFEQAGKGRPQIASLNEADVADKIQEGQCCVFYQTEPSSLGAQTDETLEAMKKLFMKSSRGGVLWVTHGAVDGSTVPDFALISGLMRTLRVELGGPLIHLDMDWETPLSDEAMTQTVLRVYERSFGDKTATHDVNAAAPTAQDELELAERKGFVQIPRYVEATSMCDYVASRTGALMMQDAPVVQPGRALKLEVGQPGMLDSLYFDDDERVLGDLPEDYVEIEVKASSLNFHDVMVAMGQIDTHDLGRECSGVVAKVGAAVSNVQVGDRVAAPADGTFATLVRTPAWRAQKMPDDMSFETAATLPIVFCTAYHAVQQVANLARGETVLIHAASGGLGQALIQLCRHRGAGAIFVTVGSAEKKQFLMEHYDIPEAHIFSSRDDSFGRGVKLATGGRGVDVVFNSLSSDLLRVTWSCMASFGRFVELGKKDFAVNSRLEMAPFARNVTFAAVDLIALLAERPEYSARLWSEAMELVKSGAVRAPEPITVCGLAEVETALRTMQGGRHIGKLVLVPRADEKAKVMQATAPAATLKSDASYVLVGGLGGIGRALSLQMFELGARHFIFFSRGGSTNKKAEETVEKLRQQGAQVEVFECDVANRALLEQALASASAAFPPVRGVVHLGLVIKSALFQDMGTEAWNDSIWPKVPGTWNLHELLPPDMDFFIMLSSMVGIIGNPSQTAYGAASTFQDAFANYRNRMGLPAVSIDLGMVTGIGYVAERDNVQKTLRSQGFEEINERECLAIIESAMARPSRPLGAGNVVTGLGLGRHTGGDTLRAPYQNPRFALARRMALRAEEEMHGGSGGASGGEAGGALRIRDRVRQAESFGALLEIITGAVAAKMASLLMLQAEEVSAQKPMSHYGMDSLVAVEMRNWVSSELEATIPVLEFLGSHSIQDVCESIAKQSRLANKDLPM